MLSPSGGCGGEVVFNTSMFGHQEIMTDPSSFGQIIVFTYPLIGNYGGSEIFSLSQKPQASGLVVRELCDYPNNHAMEYTFPEYLMKWGIPCLHGVDTRALAKKIRDSGTMRGFIKRRDDTAPDFSSTEPGIESSLSKISAREIYSIPGGDVNVAVLDFGVRSDVLSALHDIGLNLVIIPFGTPAEKILSLSPDGIFLSDGPGSQNPAKLEHSIKNLKNLIQNSRQKIPVFGVGLGHLLMGLAMGAEAEKLKFGHHGSNHPVKDLLSDNYVFMTSQNHNYILGKHSAERSGFEITHAELNDGTAEGMRHRELPLFSVQYQYVPQDKKIKSPNDDLSLFRQFLSMANETKNSGLAADKKGGQKCRD
ncbi:MAG: carbamoyl phosphate synthase small subunit [Synergistaceae bacterium]|nr:carbamoyl phosphate synthase small subunit [Synergistaceae bacterium]